MRDPTFGPGRRTPLGEPLVDAGTGAAAVRAAPAAPVRGSSQSPPPHDSAVQVVVRVRPVSATELARGEQQAITIAQDGEGLRVEAPPRVEGAGAATGSRRNFHMRCLGPEVHQREVVERTGIVHMLRSALQGYSSTIFAYGQTGSGKTYTLSGTEELLAGRDGELRGYAESTEEREDDGIILRSLRALFDLMDANDAVRYSVRVCYLEIYNERCYDLLREEPDAEPGSLAADTAAPISLPVRWEKGKGFSVPAQTSVPCKTVVDALQAVRLGNQRRRVASHLLNADSSRSHSMLTVHVDSTPIAGGGESSKGSKAVVAPTRLGKVTFVDLAGSERLKATRSSGATQKETQAINKSLFALGKVIATLGEPRDVNGSTVGASTLRGGDISAHVPYRDSVLTKLLQDSLGGTSLALMIACCSPLRSHAEETLSTMHYAMRAANITNTPAVRVDPNESLIQSLRKENELLRKENALLRKQAAAGGGARGQPLAQQQQQGDMPARQSHVARNLPPLPSTPPAAVAGQAGAGARARARRKSHVPVASTRREYLSVPERPHSVTLGGQMPQNFDAVMLDGTLNPWRSGDYSQMLQAYAHENNRLSDEVEALRGTRRLLELDHEGLAEENLRLERRLELVEGVFSGLGSDGDGQGGDSAAEIARLKNANEELKRKAERQKAETEEMKAMVREMLKAAEEAQRVRQAREARRAERRAQDVAEARAHGEKIAARASAIMGRKSPKSAPPAELRVTAGGESSDWSDGGSDSWSDEEASHQVRA